MKVGDLVKYKDWVNGMADLVGIIIGWNGEYPVVLWNTGLEQFALLGMIEVLNENR